MKPLKLLYFVTHGSYIISRNFPNVKGVLENFPNNIAQSFEELFMQLAQKIKEICDNHNISGVELGKMLGLRQSPLTDWKNGKAKPTLDQFKAICEYFSISADYLLMDTEPLPKELAADEAEWLELYRKLEPMRQAEYRAELRGYVKAIGQNKQG